MDNNILVTVNQQAPVNVCSGGYAEGGSTPALYNQNCFQFKGYWQYYPNSPSLVGDDPDTYVTPAGKTIAAGGGVAPIDLGTAGQNLLSAGQQDVTIAFTNEGGWLTNSTIFLTTNCTEGGVTGPAVVQGNPIPPTNPTPGQLNQVFNFNTNNNQGIGFVYNLSGAEAAGTLTTNSEGATPVVTDVPVNPGIDPNTQQNAFQGNFVSGTSFATASCLIHNGEVGGPSNLPACKLYTLECTTGTGSNATGAQCPASTVANEVFQDVFDGPNFTVPSYTAPVNGVPTTFHQGFGLLMASEGWGSESTSTWDWNGGTTTGGPCTFDPNSGLQNLDCPQNLLISFTGPGTTAGTGVGEKPNSTFIGIYQIPEDLTTVTVTNASGVPTPLNPGNWTNQPNVNVVLSSQPPVAAGATPPLPNAANFVPAPIKTITFGLSTAASVPLPINQPIAGDDVFTNSVLCPAPMTAGNATVLTTPVENFALNQGDGYYLLHYYAQDCSGTEELLFTNTAPDGSGTWSTNFYTFPINLDTVPPVVSVPTFSATPPFVVGQSVTASYSCTDSLSGVVSCGNETFSTPTQNTGTLNAPVPTSTPGNQTFTVTAMDAAGNQSSQSVNYTVLVAPTIVISTSVTLATKSGPGTGYVATVKVTNTGTGTAPNVKLTAAKLGAASLSSFPAAIPSLGPGASGTFVLTFPYSAGNDGKAVGESYAGTYTGGSFSYSVRSVTLP